MDHYDVMAVVRGRGDHQLGKGFLEEGGEILDGLA